jgi:hypothetical protein
VRGVGESQQQNKEITAYKRSNVSTVLHQQPRPPYILAAGKSKTAPDLNPTLRNQEMWGSEGTDPRTLSSNTRLVSVTLRPF